MKLDLSMEIKQTLRRRRVFHCSKTSISDLDKKPQSSGSISVIPTSLVYFCLEITKHSFYFYKQSSPLKMKISICTHMHSSPYAKPIPVSAWLAVSVCPNYVSPTNSLSLQSPINRHFLGEVFPLIRCLLPPSPLYFQKTMFFVKKKKLLLYTYFCVYLFMVYLPHRLSVPLGQGQVCLWCPCCILHT